MPGDIHIKRSKTPYFIAIFLILVALPFLQGCGLIFGGDQRVDNKSHDYTVVRLDRDPSREWHTLAPAESQVEGGDVAFEHAKSGAIISLNSVCREYRDASLEELSHYLLLGLNKRGSVTTRNIEVDGVKALESNVEASMSQRSPSRENTEFPVKVRTVVLRKNGCTYDLMYIARPQYFDQLLPHFDRFLKGFHAE